MRRRRRKKWTWKKRPKTLARSELFSEIKTFLASLDTVMAALVEYQPVHYTATEDDAENVEGWARQIFGILKEGWPVGVPEFACPDESKFMNIWWFLTTGTRGRGKDAKQSRSDLRDSVAAARKAFLDALPPTLKNIPIYSEKLSIINWHTPPDAKELEEAALVSEFEKLYVYQRQAPLLLLFMFCSCRSGPCLRAAGFTIDKYLQTMVDEADYNDQIFCDFDDPDPENALWISSI
jgi:hypothetical protein